MVVKLRRKTCEAHAVTFATVSQLDRGTELAQNKSMMRVKAVSSTVYLMRQDFVRSRT